MSEARGEDGRVQFLRKGEQRRSGRACTRPSRCVDVERISSRSHDARIYVTVIKLTAEQQAEVDARVAAITLRVENELKRLGLKRGAREEEIALTSVERMLARRKERGG